MSARVGPGLEMTGEGGLARSRNSVPGMTVAMRVTIVPLLRVPCLPGLDKPVSLEQFPGWT